MSTASSLGALIQSVSKERSLSKALDLISHNTLAITGSGHVMVAMLNEEEGLLEVSYGAGKQFADRAKNLKLQIGGDVGIIAYVAATGDAVLSNNVREEPRYHVRFESTASEIAVPIKDTYGRMRGVLNLEAERLDAYTDDHLQAAKGLAALAAMIIEREDHAKREEALVEIGSALDSALTEQAWQDMNRPRDGDRPRMVASTAS